MELTLINNQDQSYAEKKLAKYYENELIPAEKKTYLTELQNNHGPFMGIETDNNETHYLMDAASQIATLGLGFSPSVFMGTAHHLSSWTNNSEDPTFLKIKNAFHSFLLRKTGWHHLDMTVCNSGAESNEIALGYAYKRRKNKNANKVLAFEGSFHGRMLISLFSTWNQSKREPFQWQGYETAFVPFPELPGAEINLKYPQNWRELWDSSTKTNFEVPKEWLQDSMLKMEVDSLLAVRDTLKKGETFAVIVEPMQCEGGDRYGSDRFHTALILMARAFNVSVIHDEVQTGFHLGREFFWHRQFCLTDQWDNQLNPDFLVCAKKAQVGLVLSPHDLKRKGLEAKEQFQTASLIRGYYHGLALDQSKPKILKIEEYTKQKLAEFQKKFSSKVSRPRALGISFAFDLEDAETTTNFISKRFDHGLLYYPAGAKTLRFRLNTSFSHKDIDFLFERLEDIAQDVFEGKSSNFNGKTTTVPRSVRKTTQWQELLLEARLDKLNGKQKSNDEAMKAIKDLFEKNHKAGNKNLELVEISSKNFSQYKEDIIQLQKEVYEPTRQTSIDHFEACAQSKNGLNLGLWDGEKLAAIVFSSNLNEHPLERGVRLDPDFNKEDCLYMIDTTVREQYRSFGFGRFLKYALTYLALNRGYRAIKGRNRDKLAAPMLNINLSLGSIEQFHLREDYPDFEKYRDVIYYQSLLNWEVGFVNLGNRINSPLEATDLDAQYLKDQLPYLTNKVCLSNFVSENFLAHVKYILELAPKNLQHGYTASGQSECVDKVFKSIIYNAENFDHSSKMLTFEGSFFGTGSFLSRSLTGPTKDAYFPVEKLPCPTESSQKEVLANVEKLLKAKEINSVWIEPLQQENYIETPFEFLKELKVLCQKHSIPLVYNETASQQFSYQDDHYFASNNSDITPDAAFAFLGGQAGIVFLNESIFVSKPLMMISTWDGDEHAFASYHKAASDILKDTSSFIKTRNQFQQKLESEIKENCEVCCSLQKGRGIVAGPLPYSWRRILRKTHGGYLVDPSYGAMKSFLEVK